MTLQLINPENLPAPPAAGRPLRAEQHAPNRAMNCGQYQGDGHGYRAQAGQLPRRGDH
jgi:hypothetical protein